MKYQISSDLIVCQVLDFMVILQDCHKSTVFSEDRSVYANDIVAASSWLTRLHKGDPLGEIIDDILDAKTAKQFTDYWRQGKWGERHNSAFQKLVEGVRCMANGGQVSMRSKD